ncbi:hypothetical protein P153DRAFT_30849 [Dothidotthia symphoricarpi CBS 119687]|uniref:WD40 repeat-like protein n=1 Tax=Dothidotthia symphoricarpi CBS 119687 TaxID=1392245 RepID=A0A6A6AB48_9PLEO|nr:uncharacterized protein P153DRAFT_30849 [Dothidotthia symphoricarpi CBS 119687]KAF2129050.1 hypothetical protein P153DRAFT_30849 [Dothidotthia symphoricarpi CBS 119687]
MWHHISCTLTSVQQGSQRFPSPYDRPKIKAWRCELTALSTCYNLYFVVCNDTIHVYNPSFPNQRLSHEPVFILYPPVSSPHLRPSIDPEDPHSISRIHIDHLGHEEIVLVACDDGDVVGYRVDEIQRALERRSKFTDGGSEVTNGDAVKVLFHHNVGASAWGIAVHQEARMIAVSANTHNITVFAFALTSSLQHLDESGSHDNRVPLSNQSRLDLHAPRREDRVITLRAGTNVPAVSFNNSGSDPYGRWLSSSSIDGKTILWDLHHPQAPARVIQLGFCASVQHTNQAPRLPPGMCHCPRSSAFPHGAWGTVFLDPHSAYEDAAVNEPAPAHISPCFQDVSTQKAGFFTKSKDDFSSTGVQETESFDGESSDMILSDTESGVSEEDILDSSTDSAHANFLEHTQDDKNDEASPESDQTSVESGEEMIHDDSSQQSSSQLSSLFIPEQSQSAVQTVANAISAHASNTPLPWFQPFNQEVAATMYDSDDDSDTNSEIFNITFAAAYLRPSIGARPNPAYFEVTTSPSFQSQSTHLSTPCLIVTKEDIFLFQCPLGALNYPLDPIVTMRRPLHPPDNRSGWGGQILPSHDRLCFSTQIPELGIFIVATPHGRAGVFSLTWSKQKDRPVPTYKFQLEYILPFSKDNNKELWSVGPHVRLLGVAVGPVQGMFDQFEKIGEAADGVRVSPSRRWRLFMYFSNHTVVSYELSKMRVGESPSLGDLVV